MNIKSLNNIRKQIQYGDNKEEHRRRKLDETQLLEYTWREFDADGEERPQESRHGDGHKEPPTERKEIRPDERHNERVHRGKDGKQDEIPLRTDGIEHLAFQNSHRVDEQLDDNNEHHRKDHVLSDIGIKMCYQSAQIIANHRRHSLTDAESDGNPDLLRRLVVSLNQPHRARGHGGSEAEDEEDADND